MENMHANAKYPVTLFVSALEMKVPNKLFFKNQLNHKISTVKMLTTKKILENFRYY